MNLSNVGLAMQGLKQAEQDQQSLQSGQQKLDTGQIGLDELKRQTASAQGIRTAVQGASNRTDAYDAAANSAKESGDIDTYSKYKDAAKLAQQEGMGQLANAAVTGLPTDQAEKIFNDIGTNKLMPGSLEYGKDPKSGDVFIKAKKENGEDLPVLNASKWIAMHQKTTKLAPGEALVPEHGGAPIASNEPLDKFDVKEGIVYNKKTGAWQQVDIKGDWKLGTIVNGDKEVPVAINSRDGTVSQLGPGGVRTGLEAKVTQNPAGGNPLISLPGGGVAEFKPSQDAVPGVSKVFGKDVPAQPARPATLTPAQMDAPPMQGAQKAPDGNWYVKQGNGWARVNVSGQPTATDQQQATQQPQQPAKKATPVASPQKPTPPTLPETKNMDGKMYIKANNRMGWEEANIFQENGRWYMKQGRGAIEVQPPKKFADGGKVTKYQNGGL